MKMQPEVRERIETLIHERAGECDWAILTDRERAQSYAEWVNDPRIGGVLGHYMDPRQVRVYIKDTLLKPYMREELRSKLPAVLVTLGLSSDSPIESSLIKPHSVRLTSGEQVCWGNSRDWKNLLMAAFERAQASGGATYVVMAETGQTKDATTRALVRDAAARLGLARVEWLR